MTRQYHKHQCALSLKFYKMLTLGLIFRFSYTASQIRSAFCEPLLIPASLPGKKAKVVQSCRTLCDPMDCVHGILQTRILEWEAVPFSRGSSHSGIEPRSPTPQVNSLPAEPQGKPKNTGVGSLSLLQRICLSQESNLELANLILNGEIIYLSP